MKKYSIKSVAHLFLMALTLAFFSCKQETREKVEAAGEAVAEEAEEATDAVKEAAGEVKDAVVAGTNFNATGMVPCGGGNCNFGVVRRGNGDADVQITKADGSLRIIYFQGGKVVGYDKDTGDAGALKSSKESDLYIVEIGDERYEIPEAVIFGG